MTNQKLALNYAYIMLITAFVCTGMIMDAEVLVLYVWILFVGLAYSYGSAIVNATISSEASKIGKEFDFFFETQKKVIKTLIHYHILQVLVLSQIKALLAFSKEEIVKVIASKKRSLDNTLALQMDSKLGYLAAKEQAIELSIQKTACNVITQKVYDVFLTDNKDKKAIKERILAENMAKLENMK
jgi:hypothetical protein